MAHVDDIISLMYSPSKKDRELIETAYNYSKEAHKDQKRYSGEPYFNHVFETAKILAGLGMGARTVSAGLLHDTLEDVESVTAEDLEEKFGTDILFLIEGVTKLGKVRYKGATRHVKSLQKLFVATSEDIRVLIIKLADRLHNMRTLEHVPAEKRQRIAVETMEVYVPIAYRLGMGLLKGELEDLAFQYIHPKEYEEVVEISKSRYKESKERLEKVYRRLQKELASQDLKEFKTDYRRKHLYSLWKKLVRKDMDIERVYDILALRIIVPNVSDCYRVLGVIHSLWRPLPGRIKDYIAFPKPNGYQSIHTTIFTGDGGIAEIQIRTEEMHREAEFGIASHALYKSGEEKTKTDAPIDWFKQILPPLLKDENNNNQKELTDITETPGWIKELAKTQSEARGKQEFYKNLKSDFFEDRIFVFTPKGDVIDLPVDSSPIDFAYHIHTDIGNHIDFAKVNYKMASLGTPLKNGDIVEIGTRKASKPSRRWLEYAKTSFARRHIKSSLQKQKEEKRR